MQLRPINARQHLAHMVASPREVTHALISLGQIVSVGIVSRSDAVSSLEQRDCLAISFAVEIECAEPMIGFEIPRRFDNSRAQFTFRASFKLERHVFGSSGRILFRSGLER